MRISIQFITEHMRSPLYRNSFFLMANQVVTAGLGFFFWMVVARFYTVAEVGWGAATISAMSLMVLLGMIGLDIALIRFLPTAEKPQDMINSCLTISGIVSLVLSVIFIVGLDIWSPALSFIKKDLTFSTAFVFFVLIQTLGGVLGSVFVAKRRADFVLSKSTIFAVLKIPLPVALVLFFHTFGIAASWGIAATVAFVIALLFFVPRVQQHYKPVPGLYPGVLGGMWRYSSGSYLAHLFDSAPTLVLPVMVVNLLGAEQNAYFYVAWMVGSLLFAIPGAVARSLFAEGAHFEEELWGNVIKSLRLIFLLLVPAVVLVLFLGKWLLLLFGEGYSLNGLLLLRILCISSLFVGLNRIYIATLRVEDRIKELTLISGFITATTLLGSYFIIPQAGMAGIGYVWLAAEVIVSIYVILVIRWRYRRSRVRAE